MRKRFVAIREDVPGNDWLARLLPDALRPKPGIWTGLILHSPRRAGWRFETRYVEGWCNSKPTESLLWASRCSLPVAKR